MKQSLNRFVLASLTVGAWAKGGELSPMRSPFRVAASVHKIAKENFFGEAKGYALETAMSMPGTDPPGHSTRPTPPPVAPSHAATSAPVAAPKTLAPTAEPKGSTSHPTLESPTVTTLPTLVHVATDSPIVATTQPSKYPTVSLPPAAPIEPPQAPMPVIAQPSKYPTGSFAPSAPIEPPQAPMPVIAQPSKYPTGSFAPSASIESPQAPVPVTTSTPAMFDTSQPIATTAESTFTCIDDGVTFASQPFQAKRIDITVGYEVESLLPLEAFRQQMEKLILGSILVGALECGRLDVEGNAPMNTSLTDGRCLSEIDLMNDCVVAQTSATVLLVGENVDPPIARFLAFVKMQRDMETFHEFLDGVDRVTYITPTLLAPPRISAPDDPDEPGSLRSDNGRLSATPWTIGSALAMCIGGIVSLWAWSRNRRTRHERHMNHLEGSSVLSPDTNHA